MGIPIKLKRHLSDSTIPSVVLESGEPLYMKTTNRLYIGDGTTNATLLQYIGQSTQASLDSLINGLASGSDTYPVSKATTASKLGTNGGSSDKPVYFSNGVPVAGYFIPKLNGVNSTSAVSFYAPISAGTSGQLLVSVSNASPVWANTSDITVGNATSAASCTGNSATATNATNADITNLDSGANTRIRFKIGNGAEYDKTITVNVPGTVDYAKQLYETDNTNPHSGSYYLNYNNLTNKPSIPTVTNYYWANVKVSSTSNTSSSPTFGAITVSSINNYSLGAACAKGVEDSYSASYISYTGTNLVTERDVYYGLPTINGGHAYTSSSTYFAPTSAGTSTYVLKSNGSGAPSWMTQSSITAGKSDKIKIGSTYYSASFSGGVLSFSS